MAILNRHLATNLFPDPKVVKKLEVFVEEEMKKSKYDIPTDFIPTKWPEYHA
jgi:hypothetical protein